MSYFVKFAKTNYENSFWVSGCLRYCFERQLKGTLSIKPSVNLNAPPWHYKSRYSLPGRGFTKPPNSNCSSTAAS